MTLPEATTDIVLRLLTFEEYDAGVQFLETMRGVVKDLRPDLHAPVTKAASATRFAEELRKPADLVIVSAHGPAYKIGKPFEPGLCASTDGLHWLSLHEICPAAGDSISVPGSSGTRATRGGPVSVTNWSLCWHMRSRTSA